jgi:3-methyladenine DNA glycosylase AlkD
MRLSAPDAELVVAIRDGLGELAQPARAPQMQAYMKSALPYLGVRVPQVRALVRTEVRHRPPASTDALRDVVLTLWHDATYREERYAATEATGAPSVRALRSPGQISLYEQLIVSGAWWDHVDEVSHRVGDLLLLFPDAIRPVVAAWQRSPNLWLRRSSIICQVGARDRTDPALLSDAVLANAGESDFFLRKAIGWALRDYARTNREWVREFVAGHELSPLSAREATKQLR